MIVKPPSLTTTADSVGWSGSRDRRFTVKSAYSLISNVAIPQPNPVWRVVKLGRNNLTLSVAFAYDMENWDLMFGYVLWNLWNQRNAFVFKNPNGAHGNIIERAHFMVDNIVVPSASPREPLVDAGAQHVTAGGWLPPKHDWIKDFKVVALSSNCIEPFNDLFIVVFVDSTLGIPDDSYSLLRPSDWLTLCLLGHHT
ncbi:hypothetical protein V6N13_074809 [Hibiscus sabdariffa]